MEQNVQRSLVQVRILKYASRVFTYAVPADLQNKIALHMLVQVPFKKNIVPALVESWADATIKYPFEIKEICSLYPFPDDKQYEAFICAVATYYQTDPLYLFKRVHTFLQEQEEMLDDALQGTSLLEEQLLSTVLTDEQQQVYQSIAHDITLGGQQVFVLHGVTGSGKTEIYKKLIADAVNQGKAVIIMLPEVTLCLQFEKLFKQVFLDVPVIGFHSATPVKTKKFLWQLLLQSKPVIMLGVHLPVLLPIAHLGLIIVDEEHEAGYQEKKHPKIHSRDMAVLKAVRYQVPIILGSATPSVQTLWNVAKRHWKLLQLTQRFAGAFPKVQIVSLKEKELRKFFWITETLRLAIQDRLDKKEQTIIFLNRRGYSFFVQCSCGYVFTCHSCSVSLTLHSDQYMVCHYCGYKQIIPTSCPTCKLPSSDFVKKGIGTQQLVAMLQTLFPKAVIARADADTTSKKRSWSQTVSDMISGDIDILVGTQSVTKGYHFPKVTLVGILWADLQLHFPVYNAAEITLQQLIQVAGRAGRASTDSLVIVQTFDRHAIYACMDQIRYPSFYEQEIVKRAEAGYPPCLHIAEIEVRHKNQMLVEQEATDLAQQLKQQVMKLPEMQIQVLGPVAALVYKIQNVYVQKITLKSASRANMIALFEQVKQVERQSNLFFTIDPVA